VLWPASETMTPLLTAACGALLTAPSCHQLAEVIVSTKWVASVAVMVPATATAAKFRNLATARCAPEAGIYA
jgi:hypothetical protein